MRPRRSAAEDSIAPCTIFWSTIATWRMSGRLFDNSSQVPKVVALERDKRVRIIRNGVYAALVNRYGRI